MILIPNQTNYLQCIYTNSDTYDRSRQNFSMSYAFLLFFFAFCGRYIAVEILFIKRRATTQKVFILQRITGGSKVVTPTFLLSSHFSSREWLGILGTLPPIHNATGPPNEIPRHLARCRAVLHCVWLSAGIRVPQLTGKGLAGCWEVQ